MEYMKGLEDNAFDLAIVDPPYNLRRFANDRPTSRLDKYGKQRDWNNAPLSDGYFPELFRISANQIVWGANYFSCLPNSQGWLFWDKGQPAPSFADGELAWTSIDKPLRKIDLRYFGPHGSDILRIHPAQKPVKLYDWLLTNYSEPGQRILDTHLGSGSSAIAAHYFGVDFVGCEIDKDYYDAAVKRFDAETAQLDIFG
jgi:site-specific DNA-methyltransferase (adenine-specific)